MGTSSISANLDDKVINCAYYRDIDLGESVAPVDLSICVKHEYVTTANIAQEIILEQFVIPKEYLETKGLMGATAVEQKTEFHLLNLRYLDNLYVEIREVRDSISVFTRVPILQGGDYETVAPLPTNPERYSEHDENIPAIIPDRNISILKTDIGILYLLNDTALLAIQTSQRIFLVEENGEQNFVQLAYNEKGDRLFIENSITNLLPNPQFSGTEGFPSLWEIDAPGIVVNSLLLDGEIEGTYIWQLRASNPNLFNAFNNITLKTTGNYHLYSGLTALTFSVFYRLKCDTGEVPFNNFNTKINFYFNDNFIRSEQVSIIVTEEMKVWKLISFTLQGSQIPSSANKYSLEFDIANIDQTDLFNIELYLPQLEALPCATTRTVDARIEDKYVTGTIFELKLPFYILIKTRHITGPGISGLCSSTINQMNGFEFLSSNDRLRFKWYDAVGNIQLNIASNVFPPSIHANDIVDYGLWITGSVIEFYVNGGLLSSHANTVLIDQNQYYNVGSLEKSNTTINNELLDFKVLKYRV